MLGKFDAERLSSIPISDANLGGHKFKDIREVKPLGSQRLISTGNIKARPKIRRCPKFGGKRVKNCRDGTAVVSQLFY
jgi:hypothetical protein